MQRHRRYNDCKIQLEANVKQKIVEASGYWNLELEEDQYAELAYRPTKCAREYRGVALRKKNLVKEGQWSTLSASHDPASSRFPSWSQYASDDTRAPV